MASSLEEQWELLQGPERWDKDLQRPSNKYLSLSLQLHLQLHPSIDAKRPALCQSQELQAIFRKAAEAGGSHCPYQAGWATSPMWSRVKLCTVPPSSAPPQQPGFTLSLNSGHGEVRKYGEAPILLPTLPAP